MKTEIEQTLVTLKRGGLILYPTDTLWGIGCDATNTAAVERVFQLKERAESMALICLVNDFKMLNKFIEKVPEITCELLKNPDKPTTIIYDGPIGVAQNLIADDNSLAIRVVQDDFCKKLIRKFGRPIVSTSANVSGEKAPQSFQEINQKILEGVDYVVNLHRNKKATKPSVIFKLKNDGTVTVIRN
ncbi:MAG: L-threonylcarbamoyladenylate synthase [Bacteroidetes bacterium]|nr:L-threonylcarbamoyladenylate synthase [Bacteroidota bacterium]